MRPDSNQPFTRMDPRRRNVAVVGAVVLLHVGGLWALHTGLLRRAVELVVPVSVISEFIEPPKPVVEPPPPAPPKPAPRPVARQVEPTPPPPPQPIAIADPTPAPQAPVGVIAPPTPLPPIAAPVAQAAAPAAPPPPPPAPKIELPSSDAEYLRNPLPAYPPISKRMGEQGKVVVRAFIGLDGTAQKAEIRQSSGYQRLDDAAVQTVLRWRYVPGKRGGVPEAMWFNIPINFVLE